MSAKFDFSDVDTNKKNETADGKPRYIKLSNDKPRVRTVTVSEVRNGETTQGEPFIKVIVADTESYIAENDFFINTETKPGKTTCAFNVSKTDFIKLLVATGTKTEEEAKTFLGTAKNDADLASKLSTCVGKKFKMGFWGKIVTKRDGGKFLKTMFAQGKNNILPVTANDTEINTNSNKDETKNYTPDNATGTSATKKEVVHTDDLPF